MAIYLESAQQGDQTQKAVCQFAIAIASRFESLCNAEDLPLSDLTYIHYMAVLHN